MRALRLACAALSLTLAAAALAQDRPPKIGLVLSGGGARGGAHLGVLKVLEELHVPVDVIVGTSAGAIVGAAYASGLRVEEIEAEMRQLRTETIVHDVARTDLPVRRKDDEARNYIGPEFGLSASGLSLPKAAVSGVALEAVLRRLTARQRSDAFDALPIPFRAVATDLATAEMVVLERGSLATAIRASMALPAIVNPVELDGRLLVDGGVSRNLPVDVARALGAQIVIAVNIGTPMRGRSELNSLLSVTDQMTRFLTTQNVQRSLAELRSDDVLITPELGDVDSTDFDRTLEATAAGERAARALGERLRALSLPLAQYAALRAGRAAAGAQGPMVGEVQVRGTQRVNPQTVRAALSTQPGQPLDAARADADMRRLYGSGDFERVSYVLSELPDGRRVFTADVSERAWGPHYLRIGLGLASDFDGNANYNLLVTTRSTWLNRLGGEWRNDLQTGQTDLVRTEWHQPLDAAQSFFAATHAQLLREPFDVFATDRRIGRYRRSSEAVGLDAGLAMGLPGELRFGVSRGRVRLRTDTGIVSGSTLVPRADTAGLSARLRFDTLDSLRFPRQGYALDAHLFRSQPALGADDRYGKLSVSLLGAASIAAHSLRAALFDTRSAGSGAMPDYELTSLGGFLRLSGYPNGRFLATESRLGRLVYTWRIAAPGLLDGAYLGASVEWGRITDVLGTYTGVPLRGNALFVAVDTPVGPIYLGHGRSSRGEQATYFYLGLP